MQCGRHRQDGERIPHYFSVSRYATTAFASSGLSLKSGMGGPARSPSGQTAVSRNFVIAAVPRVFHTLPPGVMSGDIAFQLGTGLDGLKSSMVPLSDWFLSG